MTLADLVNKKYEVAKEVSELKLWLAQKASIEYYNYLTNGGNARTAKDKVLDELKMKEENTQWLQKEQDYEAFKVTYVYLVDCLNIAQVLTPIGFTETQEFLDNIKEL